jgi:hypothetical protein
MAGTNLTYFDAALKIDYLPVVRSQLNNDKILTSKIARNERDVVGKEWRGVAHYGRNSGIGSGSETGALPTAGYQAYANPYGSVKYIRGRIQVSGPVMEASKNDKGAIVRALASEIQGVTEDMKKEVNYQLFNDGTATRAVINGDPGTEVTLTLDGVGTRYLWDGMHIDILDPAGAETTSGLDLTITSVDSATQATLSAAANADVADNDVITRAGATNNTTGASFVSYEMMGLKGIVDDGTYVTTLHNLSRSSYAWWKCSTFSTDDNSGTNRDLTLTLMQSAVSAVEMNGGKVNLIVCDHAIRDAYAGLVIADKRYPNTMKLDGGFTALEFNGIPIVPDADCQPNTMYFLDTDHLQIMQMADWNWMDKDGAVLSRVAGYDAYEAVLYWYADLTTDKPRAHSFLRDIK